MQFDGHSLATQFHFQPKRSRGDRTGYAEELVVCERETARRRVTKRRGEVFDVLGERTGCVGV
jgi:hypothetical protein